MTPNEPSSPHDDPGPASEQDALRRLEQRLDRASDAAERLISEAARAAASVRARTGGVGPEAGAGRGGPEAGAGDGGPEAGGVGPEARAGGGPEAAAGGPEAGVIGPEARAGGGPEAAADGPEAGVVGPEAGAGGPEAGVVGPDPGAGGPEGAGGGARPGSAGNSAGDGGQGQSSKPPPAGWQLPGSERPEAGRSPDVELLAHLLQSLRDLIPPELQERLATALHELLLALRALIDWYVERMERRRAQPTEVEDIPIL